MPKQKRSFVVEIEARLAVRAFDEDSARKKVEKAFASGRPLGVDVKAGPEYGPMQSSHRGRRRPEPSSRRSGFPPHGSAAPRIGTGTVAQPRWLASVGHRDCPVHHACRRRDGASRAAVRSAISRCAGAVIGQWAGNGVAIAGGPSLPAPSVK